MHRRAREHDPEQEQHDHRADVDEHLHPRDEFLAEQEELTRAAGEHDHEEQRRVHDVLRRDDTDGAQRHRGREHTERDVLRDHYFFPFWAPSSSGSGSGTVSIHSPSLSLSCSSSAMRRSEYSNSGLQNSASNGHTSTQMPQYMQSA